MKELQVTFKLRFATRHDEETGVHVGFCPVLGLYSQGRDKNEAEEAVQAAAASFIGACYEKDTLHSVLRRRGMTKVGPAHLAEVEEFIQVQGFEDSFERDVPLNLVIASLSAEALPC